MMDVIWNETQKVLKQGFDSKNDLGILVEE